MSGRKSMLVVVRSSSSSSSSSSGDDEEARGGDGNETSENDASSSSSSSSSSGDVSMSFAEELRKRGIKDASDIKSDDDEGVVFMVVFVVVFMLEKERARLWEERKMRLLC